jgi:hypothetical protein
MTTIIIGGLGDQGMASLATQDFATVELFSGDVDVFSETETLLDPSGDLPAFTVVGRITASKKVTLCDPGASDGSQKPVGITTAPVIDNGTDQKLQVFKSGCFNPDALNWHASFNTDDLKRLAFKGGESPLIFIQKRAG